MKPGFYGPTSQTRFRDRRDAGERLARSLRGYADRSDVIVLSLPRGGVPVGSEVAAALSLPLDVLVVRKIGVPFQPELAMGAVASGGVRVLNEDVIVNAGIDKASIEEATAEARRELERRERAYRGNKPPLDLKGRTVMLVDDGLATGATMGAAVKCVRREGASRIVVAVPVADPGIARDFARRVDEFYCVLTPDSLHSIGMWYEDFSQVSDQEVRQLLAGREEKQKLGHCAR